MGFIIFCMVFAVIYIIFGLFGIGLGIFKLLINLFVMLIVKLFEPIYKHFLNNSTGTQRQLNEEENDIERERIKRQNEWARQKLINRISIRVERLKFAYPRANPKLFTMYEKYFEVMTYHEIKDLEKKMAISHHKNRNINNKTYTYWDIADLVPMEKHFEYPLEIKIYKINKDYIIAIKNIYAGKTIIYQSKTYMPVVQLSVNVLSELSKIKSQNLSISNLNIDNISKNINNLIKL